MIVKTNFVAVTALLSATACAVACHESADVGPLVVDSDVTASDPDAPSAKPDAVLDAVDAALDTVDDAPAEVSDAEVLDAVSEVPDVTDAGHDATVGDPHNCGRPGHDCLGGTCLDDACQPFVVAASAGLGAYSVAIAMDGTNVYLFTCDGPVKDSTLLKISLGGGAVTTLASHVNSPGGIAVDATSVYWTTAGDGGADNGTVMKIAISGGPTTMLVSGQPAASSIAIDGGYIYWANSPSWGATPGAPAGSIMRVAKGGGTATPLVIHQGYPGGLMVDDAYAYWWATGVGLGDYSIRRAPIAGGAADDLWTSLTEPPQLASDATDVLWSASSAIRGVPKAGGASFLLADLKAVELTTDATKLYVATPDPEFPSAREGTIASLPLTGGAAVTLAKGLVRPWLLVNDAVSLVWTEGDTTSTLMRMAKP